MKEEAVDVQSILDEPRNGTNEYHKLSFLQGNTFLCTDGIKELADAAECFWLIDAIFSHQPAIRRKGHGDFQVWRLKVKQDNSCTLEAWTDTPEGLHSSLLVRQEIPYTSFPLLEVEVWLKDNILMLKSED